MAKKDPNRVVRKVSEYEEEMDIPLSKEDIEKHKGRVIEIGRHRLLIRGKASKQKVVMQEWLTASNQVQIINTLTGECVDSRVATAEELQEPMFPDPAAATPEEDPNWARGEGPMQFGEDLPPP